METIDAVVAESARLLGFDKLCYFGSFCIVWRWDFGAYARQFLAPPKETSTLLASAHEFARSLLRSLYSVHGHERNKQLGPPAFTATCIRACVSSDDCYAHAVAPTYHIQNN